MSRTLRIFIKPAGQVWIDFPLADGQTPADVLAQWRREGVLQTHSSLIPFDSWLYASVWEPLEPRPTVVLFPGAGAGPPKEG